MKSVISKILFIFDGLLKFTIILISALTIFMMLAVCYDIVMRYFVGESVGWVIEVSEYILVFVTFLGAAWVLREEGHVNIDYIYNKLHPKIQTIANAITSVLCTAASFVLFWYGGRLTLELFQKGIIVQENIQIPRFIIIAVIPLGSLLLSIQSIRRTYRLVKNLETLRSKEPQIEEIISKEI